MMDFPQGADLTAHPLVAGGAVEELDRPLLGLDVIAHAVDRRKAAPPEYLENLEAAVDDVAGRVLRGRDPSRGSHLRLVGFRESLAAVCGRGGRRRAVRIVAPGRRERAG